MPIRLPVLIKKSKLCAKIAARLFGGVG